MLLFVFRYRTVRSNARMKSSITPSTEKESTTNDNGSSTDEAESEGNNRLAKAWAKMLAIFQARREIPLTNRVRGPYRKLRTEFFPL